MDFVGGVRRSQHQAYPILTRARSWSSSARTASRSQEHLPKKSAIAHRGPRRRDAVRAVELGRRGRARRRARCRTGAISICRRAVERACGVPVYLCNDATAACAAELLFGAPAHRLDSLYVFVAWFIGGGLVLNGNLFPGRTGYAGSLGQILVPAVVDGKPCRRAIAASRVALRARAQRIKEGGGDVAPIWESPDDWSALEPYLDGWLDQTAEGIAVAIVDSRRDRRIPGGGDRRRASGRNPRATRGAHASRRSPSSRPRASRPFEVVEGSIGNSARAIGGASLPFLAKFMRDRELLFQEPGDRPSSRRARPPVAPVRLLTLSFTIEDSKP